MLATCRFKGRAIMRGWGGLIMRTAAVRRRCASDSAAHGTGLAAVLLAARMRRIPPAFGHAEPFSPKLLRHRTTEGTMTGVVVAHDPAGDGLPCCFAEVFQRLASVSHAARA